MDAVRLLQRLILAIVFLGSATANATTLHVQASGSGANIYPSLHLAYDAASNGDTIVIDPTLFLQNPENFLPGKQLTIKAAAYKATVSINSTPSNSSPTSAIPLTGGALIANGKNYGASTNAGMGGLYREVWWQWTSQAYCAVTFSIIGTDFPATFKVYQPNPDINHLVQIASGTSSTVINPSPGTTYYIAIGGANLNDYGDITLSIKEVDASANDFFASRESFGGVAFQEYFCSSSATKEAGEPNHAGNAGGHSLWWEWTTPFTSLATLNVQANFDTLLAVYTGSSVNALTPIASSTNGTVSFHTTAGARYEIAVDGPQTAQALSGESGGGSLVAVQYPPLAITNFSFNSITCNGNGTVTFDGTVSVANFGTAASGPLRLRFVAEPNNSNPSGEQTMLVLPIAGGSLAGGQQETYDVTNLLSAATNGSGVGGWDYRLLLEEQFGNSWLLQNAWFYDDYYLGDCSVRLTHQVDGGPVVLPAITVTGMWVPVSISNVAINVAAVLPEGVTTNLSATAYFSNGANESFTSTDWMTSLFSISTNGFLQVGAVNANTPLTIFAPYIFAGISNTSVANVTILNLGPPTLSNVTVSPGPTVSFTLHGVPNRRHAILFSPDLVHWTNLAANVICNNSGIVQYYDSTPGASARRYYRALRHPEPIAHANSK